MLEYLDNQREILLLILGLFVSISIVETLFAGESRRVPLRDRILNLGAGAIFLIAGGYFAFLLISSLLQMNLFKVSELHPLLYVLVVVLMQDFIYYFYHRLQHTSSYLWGIHKLHHTDTDVNITTSHRTHVLEQPIQALFVFVPSILFLGIHPTGSLYAFYFGMFFLYFGHSRVNLHLGPLSWIFVGPRFHRIHHSLASEHLNKNFAQFFSFLDLIFGTYAKPSPISEVETGITRCTSLRDQWAPILWPIPTARKLD